MGLFKEVCEKIAEGKDPFQLVKHREEVQPGALAWPAQAEVKYDGIFAAVVVGNHGQVKVFSRTGKPLYLECAPVFYLPPAGLYIAELICPALTLEQLSGAVNPNRKKGWPGPLHATLCAHVEWVFHDYLPLEDYLDAKLHGTGGAPLEQRRGDLEYLACDCLPLNSRLSQVEVVNSLREYEAFSERVIAAGGEGTVLKQLHAKYCPGHKGWRAVKDVRGVHLDLACQALEMGKSGTKRAGYIAKMAFCMPGHSRLFWADFGAGWTDEARRSLTERYTSGETLVGRVFHIKGLQISSTGQAIRLPKVMEERIDKEQPDE